MVHKSWGIADTDANNAIGNGLDLPNCLITLGVNVEATKVDTAGREGARVC